MEAELRESCERLRGLLAESCCRQPWRFNEQTQTVVSGQSHPLARITEPGHRLTFNLKTGREGELITEAVNALPRLLDTIAAQAAELEGLRKLAAEARELQRANYGCGSDLHLEMIDWAKKYDTAIADSDAGGG